MAEILGISSAWFLIIGLIVIVFLVMKLATKKQEYAVKLTWIFFLFFTLTVGYVYIDSNPDITTVKGFLGFIKAYFSWLFAIFENVGEITANIIRLDWGIKNS